MKGVILQHQLRMITFKKQVLNRYIPFHIVIKWPFSYTIAFLSLAIFSTLEPSFRIIQHYSIQRMIKMIILLADRFSLLVELRLVCHLLAFVWCWFNCQASIIKLKHVSSETSQCAIPWQLHATFLWESSLLFFQPRFHLSFLQSGNRNYVKNYWFPLQMIKWTHLNFKFKFKVIITYIH